MSDFEIAGINVLKQQLTLMSRQPKAMKRRDPIAERLIDEIYPELRQAKISGYSWKNLALLISEKCKIKMSANTVAKIFHEIDLRYEKETGIKALPVKTRTTCVKRGRPKKDTEHHGG